MNIRPVTKDDVEFLKTMLYEAARWNPDWPREPIEEVLAYAPEAAWLRPATGGIGAALRGIPALELLPGVEHVEPQMLMQSAQRTQERDPHQA